MAFMLCAIPKYCLEKKRFHAWTSSVTSLHSRIAGYHQEGEHEGSLSMPMIHKFISALEPRMRGQLSNGLSTAQRKLNHG